MVTCMPHVTTAAFCLACCGCWVGAGVGRGQWGTWRAVRKLSQLSCPRDGSGAECGQGRKRESSRQLGPVQLGREKMDHEELTLRLQSRRQPCV